MDYIAYLIAAILIVGTIYLVVVNMAIGRKCPLCGSNNITQRREKVIQNNNGIHDLVDEYADVCLNCGNKKIIPSNSSDGQVL